MLPILEDYLERLQSLHTDIERLIEDLPPAALDWTPGPDMNSLGALAVHVAGSQRYWFGEVVGRSPTNRDREAEFLVRGVEATRLAVRLEETIAHTRSVLAGLTLSELETRRTVPTDGREVTVAWVLAHVLRHTAMHLGHMQITRQLWDQQQQA